jgi:hypothetical protein
MPPAAPSETPLPAPHAASNHALAGVAGGAVAQTETDAAEPAAPPSAEKVVLIGSVRDLETGAPVAGAWVQRSGGEVDAAAVDPASASFRLENLDPARETVEVGAEGYLPRTVRVAETARGGVSTRIHLISIAIPGSLGSEEKHDRMGLADDADDYPSEARSPEPPAQRSSARSSAPSPGAVLHVRGGGRGEVGSAEGAGVPYVPVLERSARDLYAGHPAFRAYRSWVGQGRPADDRALAIIQALEGVDGDMETREAAAELLADVRAVLPEGGGPIVDVER